MHAAVVTAFDTPPRYQEFPDPVASQPGETVVDVVAAALHRRVRSQADGSHYTSTDRLPLVPGIDAVVRDTNGRLYYALLGDTNLGTMAERTVTESDRMVALPEGIDPIAIAAAMNPVMASWVALRQRIHFRRGQRVLILGATGNSGRMAIRVAKELGASQAFAAGRNQAKLAALQQLGADETLLYDDLRAAADVDVVLDFVWGSVAAAAMVQLLTARRDRSEKLSWIQIGSMAGLEAPIPSAALRPATDRGQRGRRGFRPGVQVRTASHRQGRGRWHLRRSSAAGTGE